MARRTQLIVALDVDTREKAVSSVEACGSCAWYKVGLQLYSRVGPAIVAALRERGKHVFLDLKLHDIPNTVAQAARAIADLGAELTTIHACAGRRAIEAARRAVEGSATRLLAVTVLTSMGDQELRDEVGLREGVAETVARYARMAMECGAHGVVASPREIGLIREAIGEPALVVTPGIRPAWAGANDQARIMTPREAAAAGADFVVVGRPILAHAEPAKAAALVMQELEL